PAIEAAMPELPPGQVSGIVVTSVSSGAGSCSRTVFYSNPGTGAEPRMTVKTSGDACGAPSPIGEHPGRSGVTPVPRVRPGAPRLIEAAIPAPASPAAPPIAAPTAAPCPPPTAPPMAAPAPAPSSPPPTARCAGSYGFVQPAKAKINPAPTAPEAIDCFVIPLLLHKPFEPNLRAG